jgi:uncharacterized protein
MSKSTFFRGLATRLIDSPKSCAAGLVLIVVVSALSTSRLTIVSGTTPFFDKDRAERRALDQFEEKFVAEDTIFVAYETADVFSKDALERVRNLSEQLEKTTVDGPGGQMLAVAEVLSLTTVKDVFGGDGAFETKRLVPTPVPDSPDALAALRARAKANPFITKNLLALDDSSTAGIAVRIAKGLDDSQRAQLLERLRVLLDAEPGFSFHLAGEIVTAAESALQMKRDLKRFVPIVYTMAILLLAFVLRRAKGVVVAMVNVTVSLLIGFAALDWVGGSINNLSTALPPLSMVLAVSSIIHFLSELAKTATTVGDTRTAAIETLTELMPAQFFCALTDAVGFGCLGISNVQAMKEFGAAAAIAVMISLLAALLLVSIAVNLGSPQKYVAPESPVTAEWFRRLTERYCTVIIRFPVPAFLLSVAMVVVIGGGMRWLVADENMIEHFSQTSRVRRDTDFLEEHLAGSMVVVVGVELPEQGAFEDPKQLEKVQALASFIEEQPEIDNVTSVVDALKLMHRGVYEEDAAYFRLPDSRAQVAQLLTMNTDERIRQFLDPERRSVRLMARSDRHGARELEKLYERLDAKLAELFPSTQTIASGNAKMYVLLVQDIVGSQINTLGLSFLLIFGPIFLLFRSVKATLYAVPSNLFPVVLSFGVMGWSGIHLNMATAMTASIVLGIAVDDTIHFIDSMRSRLAVHWDTPRALRETIELKGVGVLGTMLIITGGFGVLLTSGYSQTREFGFLTGVAMVTGGIGELLMFPPLMLLFNAKLGVPKPLQSAEVPEGTSAT